MVDWLSGSALIGLDQRTTEALSSKSTTETS